MNYRVEETEARLIIIDCESREEANIILENFSYEEVSITQISEDTLFIEDICAVGLTDEQINNAVEELTCVKESFIDYKEANLESLAKEIFNELGEEWHLYYKWEYILKCIYKKIDNIKDYESKHYEKIGKGYNSELLLNGQIVYSFDEVPF